MSGTFLGMPSLPVFGIGNLHEHEPFPKAARRELGNAQLRANLGHATRTIRDKRLAVVSELPDWEELREAGRAIKESVMARLPELLEQFEANFTARGGTIHWARDAGEANRIVAALIRDQGADEVVKVKSMATQEIGLNEYLEEQGIAAFETDLAELIVQLDHDKPSHILVPAIHKNRSQVRDIFLREMEGVDPELTNEPARLAAAARAHLRRKFLSAKVAVSGANFALADSGTLAVVESEGNGRMCLTLPETLITVMGVEKLLPAWEDLEVFMQLLPRSSTGERMNPYTSLWTGVTPDDGPQNVHLVLLDNGRSAALADEMGRSALHCIRCSACMNVCPVYERTGGHAYGSTYPGPIGAILSPLLTGITAEENNSLPYASSLCGACYDACPVKINIPDILVHLRGEDVDSKRGKKKLPSQMDLGMKAASWALSSGKNLGLVEKALPLGRLAAGPDKKITKLPGIAAGWTQSRDIPAPPSQSFRQWWDKEHRAPARPADATDPGSTRHSGRRPEGEPVNARAEILDRIRSALRDAPAVPEVPRDYRRSSELGEEELIELLTDRLLDYKANVFVEDAAAVPQRLAALLEGTGRYAVPHGLDQALFAEADAHDGGSRRRVTDAPGHRLSVEELDGMDAVVTGSAVAVAETGTIVLDAGPDQGRRVISLVPDRHICLVRAGDITAILPEALRRLDGTRPQTWISGPSATSDIELERVEGVHGPRTLDVVIVRG